ncbi:hypothetical protein EBB07_29625 [Paenibacillaceae bacterium]|nr:hypothetical protein EBB07_29625 [Paenibacillaceae bacterium]
MILGNKEFTSSPVKQNFIWVAEFADGTYKTEYNLITHQPNKFQDIDKNMLVAFGLIGSGSQIYFDVGNGIFTVNKHRLMLSYQVGDIEYAITGRTVVYNDVITYKESVTDFEVLTKGADSLQSRIMQFNVGYKKQMEFDDVNIGFQCVAGIPLNSSMILQFKISADKDMQGKLIIRRNGQIVDKIDAPLLGGHALHGNWTVK